MAKPKYKIIEVESASHPDGRFFVVKKLYFNLFYLPLINNKYYWLEINFDCLFILLSWYSGIHNSIKSAEAAIYRNKGLKVCEFCHEQLKQDSWGIYCPNEECLWMNAHEKKKTKKV